MRSSPETDNIAQAPPIQRSAMAYHHVYGKRGMARGRTRTLVLRRLLLSILVLGSMWHAAVTMAVILGSGGLTALEYVIVGIFTVLFGWIAVTFWMSLIGFIILMVRHDPFVVPKSAGPDEGAILASTTVAVVIPVYNEDAQRVFDGLQVMYASLRRTGQLEHFSFFVLSDSDDPHQWEQEKAAWARLCKKTGEAGRIFYRRRKLRIHKKSGNIADFCRRWGAQYKYMITLDADSLMGGQLMVDMVKVMETRRDVGILQTVPKGINQTSLVSRLSQFASHLYGPLSLAGSHFVQLDEGGFWGHNAIIRVAPFMKFCALPKLPGRLPFGGEILSHDFIEAALMRRAGWGIWLAHGLEGSFEELPPNFLDELERDSRWCRGNIQHLRLMSMKGIAFGHRYLFFNGNMFYFSSLLWLGMLVLMTIHAIIVPWQKVQYFPRPHSLFPDWLVTHHHLSMELLLATAIFLFLPKVLSIIWVVASRKARLFGGTLNLLLGVVLETAFSVLLAPIRMVFHSGFVISALLGGKFDWKNQSRSASGLYFAQAFKAHWSMSIMALLWGWVAFEVSKDLFLWLAVIIVPLAFSIPISMFVSWPQAGSFFKRTGLFLTPMEVRPCREMIHLNYLNKRSSS